MSVRRLATVATAAFGIIVILVAADVIWTSTVLQRSMGTVIRDTRSQAIASELELSLLTYQRISNLFTLTGDASLEEARTELRSEMQRLLREAEQYVGSSEERQRLEEVSAGLEVYLRRRQQLETTGRQLEEVVRLTRPIFNAAVEDLESLRDMNDDQVRKADASAERVNRLSSLLGWSAVALLALGSLALIFFVRRRLLRPMFALHETIGKLRSGESEARSVRGGLREIDELAEGLNRMADALARQREDQLTFLAGVAHDLRNPLSGIRVGIHALGQEQSDARRGRTHAMLDRQVDRLARMIEDLLDATRIEAGQLEMQREDFDVRQVVEDMIRLYGPTSPDHQIAADLPSEPVCIHGDALRIEQVVSNLLSNAIKFSPGGGPIRVSVGAEDEGAVLSVSDRGVGIPREELPNIFLPFRRRRLDVAPGAGLGLSVVRRIVKAHGGTMVVESEPQRGSTFTIKLPLAGEGTVQQPERSAGHADSTG